MDLNRSLTIVKLNLFIFISHGNIRNQIHKSILISSSAYGEIISVKWFLYLRPFIGLFVNHLHCNSVIILFFTSLHRWLVSRCEAGQSGHDEGHKKSLNVVWRHHGVSDGCRTLEEYRIPRLFIRG